MTSAHFTSGKILISSVGKSGLKAVVDSPADDMAGPVLPHTGSSQRRAMTESRQSSEDEDINLSEGAESKAEGRKMATGIEGVKDKDAGILSPPDGDNCKGKGSKVFGESQHSGKDTGFDGVDFLEGINLYDDDKDSAMLATKALSEQNDIPVKLKDTNLDIAELSQEQQEFMRELVAKFKNKKADIIKNVDGQAEILYSVRDSSTEPKKNLTEILKQNLEEKKGEVSEKKAQTDVDKHFNTACDSSEPKDIPDVDFQSKNSSITHPQHSGKDKGDVTVTSAAKGLQDDIKKSRKLQFFEDALLELSNQDENSVSIENLKKKKCLYFLDMDNCASFFKKICRIPSEDVLVWGFYGENFKVGSENFNETYSTMKRNRTVYLNNRCGGTKDASDFSIAVTVGRLDALLDSDVEFFVISGDKGFQEIKRRLKDNDINSSRKVTMVEPKKINELF